MAPKPEWSERWSAYAAGRRLRVQRDQALHEGDKWPWPEDESDSPEEYDKDDHQRKCLAKWGKTKGLSVEIPSRTPAQDYANAHWSYALAASFAPERHAMMLLGRPLVVPSNAFREAFS
jgi:hypothetical protein